MAMHCMLGRCNVCCGIAWCDDVLYVRAVYYLVELRNVIYLLLVLTCLLSQKPWTYQLDTREESYPPPSTF